MQKRILIAYNNGNGYGGSELFNYELILGLSEYKDLDITIGTLTKPNLNFHLWNNILDLGVKITNIQDILQGDEDFDLIIVSQPQTTYYLCQKFPNTPKISIIHSILRSEEPIKHPSIKQYIAVQVDIKKGLKKFHNIDSVLIYNPVDSLRFNTDVTDECKKYNKTTGIFIGEVNDPLRKNIIDHLVEECIKNNWDLICLSRSRRDFNTDLVKFIEPVYNTEYYLKNANFSAGLRGRVNIESIMCGIPFFAYDVDSKGNILKISLVEYLRTLKFERNFVCSKYYNLIKQIL